MSIETVPFDATKYFRTEEAQAELLAEAFETGDVAIIVHSLGIVARIRGMTDTAVAAGMSRQGLHKALGEAGDPKLSTFVEVIRALGFRLSVAPLAPRDEVSRAAS